MGNTEAGLCQNDPKHEAELRSPALQIPSQHPLPSLLPVPSRLLPPLLLPYTSFPAQDPVEAMRKPALPRKMARPAAYPLRGDRQTDPWGGTACWAPAAAGRRSRRSTGCVSGSQHLPPSHSPPIRRQEPLLPASLTTERPRVFIYHFSRPKMKAAG